MPGCESVQIARTLALTQSKLHEQMNLQIKRFAAASLFVLFVCTLCITYAVRVDLTEEQFKNLLKKESFCGFKKTYFEGGLVTGLDKKIKALNVAATVAVFNTNYFPSCTNLDAAAGMSSIFSDMQNPNSFMCQRLLATEKGSAAADPELWAFAEKIRALGSKKLNADEIIEKIYVPFTSPELWRSIVDQISRIFDDQVIFAKDPFNFKLLSTTTTTPIVMTDFALYAAENIAVWLQAFEAFVAKFSLQTKSLATQITQFSRAIDQMSRNYLPGLTTSLNDVIQPKFAPLCATLTSSAKGAGEKISDVHNMLFDRTNFNIYIGTLTAADVEKDAAGSVTFDTATVFTAEQTTHTLISSFPFGTEALFADAACAIKSATVANIFYPRRDVVEGVMTAIKDASLAGSKVPEAHIAHYFGVLMACLRDTSHPITKLLLTKNSTVMRFMTDVEANRDSIQNISRFFFGAPKNPGLFTRALWDSVIAAINVMCFCTVDGMRNDQSFMRLIIDSPKILNIPKANSVILQTAYFGLTQEPQAFVRKVANIHYANDAQTHVPAAHLFSVLESIMRIFSTPTCSLYNAYIGNAAYANGLRALDGVEANYLRNFFNVTPSIVAEVAAAVRTQPDIRAALKIELAKIPTFNAAIFVDKLLDHRRFFGYKVSVPRTAIEAHLPAAAAAALDNAAWKSIVEALASLVAANETSEASDERLLAVWLRLLQRLSTIADNEFAAYVFELPAITSTGFVAADFASTSEDVVAKAYAAVMKAPFWTHVCRIASFMFRDVAADAENIFDFVAKAPILGLFDAHYAAHAKAVKRAFWDARRDVFAFFERIVATVLHAGGKMQNAAALLRAVIEVLRGEHLGAVCPFAKNTLVSADAFALFRPQTVPAAYVQDVLRFGDIITAAIPTHTVPLPADAAALLRAVDALRAPETSLGPYKAYEVTCIAFKVATFHPISARMLPMLAQVRVLGVPVNIASEEALKAVLACLQQQPPIAAMMTRDLLATVKGFLSASAEIDAAVAVIGKSVPFATLSDVRTNADFGAYIERTNLAGALQTSALDRGALRKAFAAASEACEAVFGAARAMLAPFLSVGISDAALKDFLVAALARFNGRAASRAARIVATGPEALRLNAKVAAAASSVDAVAAAFVEAYGALASVIFDTTSALGVVVKEGMRLQDVIDVLRRQIVDAAAGDVFDALFLWEAATAAVESLLPPAKVPLLRPFRFDAALQLDADAWSAVAAAVGDFCFANGSKWTPEAFVRSTLRSLKVLRPVLSSVEGIDVFEVAAAENVTAETLARSTASCLTKAASWAAIAAKLREAAFDDAKAFEAGKHRYAQMHILGVKPKPTILVPWDCVAAFCKEIRKVLEFDAADAAIVNLLNSSSAFVQQQLPQAAALRESLAAAQTADAFEKAVLHAQQVAVDALKAAPSVEARSVLFAQMTKVPLGMGPFVDALVRHRPFKMAPPATAAANVAAAVEAVSTDSVLLATGEALRDACSHRLLAGDGVDEVQFLDVALAAFETDAAADLFPQLFGAVSAAARTNARLYATNILLRCCSAEALRSLHATAARLGVRAAAIGRMTRASPMDLFRLSLLSTPRLWGVRIDAPADAFYALPATDPQLAAASFKLRDGTVVAFADCWKAVLRLMEAPTEAFLADVRATDAFSAYAATLPADGAACDAATLSDVFVPFLTRSDVLAAVLHVLDGRFSTLKELAAFKGGDAASGGGVSSAAASSIANVLMRGVADALDISSDQLAHIDTRKLAAHIDEYVVPLVTRAAADLGAANAEVFAAAVTAALKDASINEPLRLVLASHSIAALTPGKKAALGEALLLNAFSAEVWAAVLRVVAAEFSLVGNALQPKTPIDAAKDAELAAAAAASKSMFAGQSAVKWALWAVGFALVCGAVVWLIVALRRRSSTVRQVPTSKA